MRTKFVLAFGALLFAHGPALANEANGMDQNKIWFTDDRGNRFTIYRNLVENKGNGLVQAWIESTLPRPTKSGAHMVKSLKTLEEYNCGQRLTRTLYIQTYGSSGLSLSGTNVEDSSKPIVPGTVGELEFAVICKDAGYETKESF
jgi:hypothetical protein